MQTTILIMNPYQGYCIITLPYHFKQLLILIAFTCTISAQGITVRINSGNPVLPFPQFNDYINDSHTFRNLAGNNAIGVTHDEMEQSIRDAYQIMMNATSWVDRGWGRFCF